mmetsp:Transcript_16738/g.33476  ORF Transcript_16738/g.33476 Transcript_16738/m.33476 type:complete len:229 (-) Transcript_16738:437-1123(-)
MILKSPERLWPELMHWMASAMSGAEETTLIFSGLAPFTGMVSDTIQYDMQLSPIRCSAGPLNSPCVAHAETVRAPISLSVSADLHRVPAVSIMSSMIMQCFPSISPTTFIPSISPGPALCFTVMARVMLEMPRVVRALRNSFARATPPASGETMQSGASSPKEGRIVLTTKGAMSRRAERLSTGALWKKPWICPQCRSTARTRSAPAFSIMMATSEAEMGTRACVLRS